MIAPAITFHFLGNRQYLFTPIPIWSTSGNLFSLWPSRPGRVLGGRRLTTSDGKILAGLRCGRTKTAPRGNPGRPPMLEDEDDLGRQNPGQDRQAPRSIILWMLRELEVKRYQSLFTLITNLFSLPQGPTITFRSNLFSLQSEKRLIFIHTHDGGQWRANGRQ